MLQSQAHMTTTTTTTSTMQHLCENEVLRIHHFFVDWLNGTVCNSNEVFEKMCDAVLAKDLVMVKTNGTVVRHDALCKELRQAHGIKKGLLFKMEIHNFEILQSRDDWCLVMYQEWHYGSRRAGDNDENEQKASTLLNDKRQCTALLRRKPNTPHGVEWVHIHETSKMEKSGV